MWLWHLAWPKSSIGLQESPSLPLLCHEFFELPFILAERITAPLIEDVQLRQVVLHQIGCHFGRAVRVVNAHHTDVPEEDICKLLHRMRVDVECLLQKLDQEELPDQPGMCVSRRFRVDAHA